jgi:hypothetical protein
MAAMEAVIFICCSLLFATRDLIMQNYFFIKSFIYLDTIFERLLCTILQNQEKLFFSALSLLIHFIELLHEISRESLVSEKLFGRAPARFNKESAL